MDVDFHMTTKAVLLGAALAGVACAPRSANDDSQGGTEGGTTGGSTEHGTAGGDGGATDDEDGATGDASTTTASDGTGATGSGDARCLEWQELEHVVWSRYDVPPPHADGWTDGLCEPVAFEGDPAEVTLTCVDVEEGEDYVVVLTSTMAAEELHDISAHQELRFSAGAGGVSLRGAEPGGPLLLAIGAATYEAGPVDLQDVSARLNPPFSAAVVDGLCPYAPNPGQPDWISQRVGVRLRYAADEMLLFDGDDVEVEVEGARYRIVVPEAFFGDWDTHDDECLDYDCITTRVNLSMARLADG